MAPVLHKQAIDSYVQAMLNRTDQISAHWADASRLDMLVEMRKVALLILMDTLFKVDFNPDLSRMLPVILRSLAYISPGLWAVWPGVPRPGYKSALASLDLYLHRLISERRASGESAGQDLLGLLVNLPEMSDELIRDQLLTVLIAGHDTSTAMLAWTLFLIGSHPQTYKRLRLEVDSVLGSHPPTLESIHHMELLDRVVQESLRLYPPIHIGSRIAARDLEFQGYHIPRGTRVVYSIYLTHRHESFWHDPDRFDPQRFCPEEIRQRPHYTYLPFGGGPRNCIGLAFAQVEVRIVLARLIQCFDLELVQREARLHMGATLEPHPGVLMRVKRRR
jgi:cytochrome P450